jgi:Domain of Unknown Function (DUF928)
MNSHFPVKLFSMSLVFTLGLQSVSLYPAKTEPLMEPETPIETAPGKKALKFMAPEARRPYPGDRSPGTGKDNCPEVAVPLTVLMPSLPNGRTFDTWGQTTQERPLIWVYVPYGSEDKLPKGQKNRFDLQLEIQEDSPGQTRKKVRVPLPKQAKIMPIALPPDYKLEVGKNYQVFVSSSCTKNNPQQARFWIQRVAAPSGLGSSSSPRDRVKLFAEKGIWLDTLTEVVKINAAPKLSEEWRSFVQVSLGWDLQESTDWGREEKKKMERILNEPIN